MKIEEIKTLVKAISRGEKKPALPVCIVVADNKIQDELRDTFAQLPGMKHIDSLDVIALTRYFDKKNGEMVPDVDAMKFKYFDENGKLCEGKGSMEIMLRTNRYRGDSITCLYDLNRLPDGRNLAVERFLAQETGKPLVVLVPVPLAPYKTSDIPFLVPFEIIECDM